jgi:hypothetical protein
MKIKMKRILFWDMTPTAVKTSNPTKLKMLDLRF